MRQRISSVGLAMLCIALSCTGALAQQHEEELAKKLSNPVADLISVPFQFNFDGNIGPPATEAGSISICSRSFHSS